MHDIGYMIKILIAQINPSILQVSMATYLEVNVAIRVLMMG
jgi:hypothetical protein